MAEPETPDWHLREWMKELGYIQASLTNDLGWAKAKAHAVWHSQQPYGRTMVNELSAWLGIEPYELLMPPSQALAIRRLRETAAQIVADKDSRPATQSTPAPSRTKVSKAS